MIGNFTPCSGRVKYRNPLLWCSSGNAGCFTDLCAWFRASRLKFLNKWSQQRLKRLLSHPSFLQLNGSNNENFCCWPEAEAAPESCVSFRSADGTPHPPKPTQNFFWQILHSSSSKLPFPMLIRIKMFCLLKSSIVKGLVICTLRLLILSLSWCKRAAAPLVCLN